MECKRQTMRLRNVCCFLLYKKMPLPENELFKKNGNRIRTEAADCAKICMKCITKI